MNMDSNRDTREDAALNALFAAADSQRPIPSEAFVERLRADAAAALPASETATPPAQTRGWHFPLAGFFTASGLTAAAAVGVWIGVVMPDTILPYGNDDTVGLYTFLPGADLTAAFSE